MKNLFIFLCSISLLSCNDKVPGPEKSLIDKAATAETKNLFRNLDRLAENHTLFGHQHATEYGHGWSGDADRSDVKSVTGSKQKRNTSNAIPEMNMLIW